VVIGIGLNVLTPLDHFPAELRERVTSIRLAGGAVVARGELLAAIVQAVEDEIDRLERGDFAVILAQWRSRDATLGKRLAWMTPTGTVVEGVSLGPDETGVLHIRDDSGLEHEVLSGDLTLSRK